MTDYLIKKFIKQNEAVMDSGVRASYGTLAGAVGICVNLMLFAGKFCIGFFAHSISVMADAFNNLSDVASSVVSLAGAQLAKKPADEEHPFGHGRIEYLAAFFVAFLVLYMGVSLLRSSVEKILHPAQLVFTWISLFGLLLSIGGKLWLSAFNGKLGKRINSEVLLAAAADARSDVLATSATVFSLLLFRFFGLNADGFIGLVVSLLVLRAGLGIARDTLRPIIGSPMDAAFSRELRAYIATFPGVLGTHDLLIHSYGPTHFFASVHVETAKDTPFDNVHLLMDRIEKAVGERFKLQLVTHADPVDVGDARLKEACETIAAAVLDTGDTGISFHDVRLVDASAGRVNVVFDLVIPWNYSSEKQKKLMQQIRSAVSSSHCNWDCVITPDHSYEADADADR